MDKGKINYWVDIGLIITFILAFVTGVFKWPSLVKYSFNLGLNMKLFSLIHDWSGLIMGLLVFVHIALHWKWLVVMTKSKFKKKEL